MDTIQTIQGSVDLRPNGQSTASPHGRSSPNRETPHTTAPKPDPEQGEALARRVQEALDKVAPATHRVAFRQDEATHSFVIEIRDLDGAVVRQYPPEKLLNLRRNLDELSGMVIDKVT